MNSKQIVLIFVLIAVDIFFLFTSESLLFLAFLALVSVIIMIRITKGLVNELFLSGAFLGIIASYHFYFRPALDLPAFNQPVLLFIGTFLLFRSLFALFSIVQVPFITPIFRAIVGK